MILVLWSNVISHLSVTLMRAIFVFISLLKLSYKIHFVYSFFWSYHIRNVLWIKLFGIIIQETFRVSTCLKLSYKKQMVYQLVWNYHRRDSWVYKLVWNSHIRNSLCIKLCGISIQETVCVSTCLDLAYKRQFVYQPVWIYHIRDSWCINFIPMMSHRSKFMMLSVFDVHMNNETRSL